MIYPKKLQQADTIGIVSPSSPVSVERAEEAKKALEDMGFNVKLCDNHSTSKGGYMAGEEKLRGEWINKMFADPEVDAIICMRGGDGANRVVDYIDLDIVRNNPKIFVGYSDITSLHLLFNQECDLVTFHGPMVSSNIVDKFDEETKAAFFSALTSDDVYEYVPPKGLELKVARPGVAKGSLTGGNLTVMCASIGTPYEMDTEGKILFIEEIGSHIGNIDRSIYQLKNAGKLDCVAGILLGQFNGCYCDEDDYDTVSVILDATKDLDIPVMYNVQSGHGYPMLNIPMHALCTLDADQKKLSFDMK